MKKIYFFIPTILIIIYLTISYYLSYNMNKKLHSYIETEISCNLIAIQESRYWNIIISDNQVSQHYLFALYGGLEVKNWKISDKLTTLCKEKNINNISLTIESPFYIIPDFYKIKITDTQNNQPIYIDAQILNNKINIVWWGQ